MPLANNTLVSAAAVRWAWVQGCCSDPKRERMAVKTDESRQTQEASEGEITQTLWLMGCGLRAGLTWSVVKRWDPEGHCERLRRTRGSWVLTRWVWGACKAKQVEKTGRELWRWTCRLMGRSELRRQTCESSPSVCLCACCCLSTSAFCPWSPLSCVLFPPPSPSSCSVASSSVISFIVCLGSIWYT